MLDTVALQLYTVEFKMELRVTRVAGNIFFKVVKFELSPSFVLSNWIDGHTYRRTDRQTWCMRMRLTVTQLHKEVATTAI